MPLKKNNYNALKSEDVILVTENKFNWLSVQAASEHTQRQIAAVTQFNSSLNDHHWFILRSTVSTFKLNPIIVTQEGRHY